MYVAYAAYDTQGCLHKEKQVKETATPEGFGLRESSVSLGIEHRALDLLCRDSSTKVCIPQYVKNFEGFFWRFDERLMKNGQLWTMAG